MSSSRTEEDEGLEVLVEEVEEGVVAMGVWLREGEGEERWRGDWPGERSIVSGERERELCWF